MDLSQKDTVAPIPDGELVRLLLTGNPDAMGEIFDRYYRLVMSVALRVLHDPTEAEDVIQIVFTDFYQKAHLFDETKGNLRTWLLQYAYERSFNQKKKLKSHLFGERVGLNHLDERRENSRPLFNLEKQNAVRFVEEILSQLTEKQRFVIQRVFFEDMDISEVAVRTGQPIGNIYHAYYRGMDKLRRLVANTEMDASSKVGLPEQRNSWLPIKRKVPQQFTGKVESVKTRTF